MADENGQRKGLATDPSVRAGALAGLALRQQAGDLSQALFSRITLIRSWLQDEESLNRIDEIIRSALKSGTQELDTRSKPKIHRVVSSMTVADGPWQWCCSSRVSG